MRGLLQSWSGLVLVTVAAACSNIIGVSDIEIDPSLDAAGSGGASTSGGKSSGGTSALPDAGEESGGVAGTPSGGTSSGGSAGQAGEGGSGGEPPVGGCEPADCDDEIDCTVDKCEDGACVHTADDAACTAAPGKCTSCKTGIGCVEYAPVEQELLLDANFDEESGDWQDFSDGVVVLPDAMAQSGTHSVYLGVAPVDATEMNFSVLSQPVYVPPRTIKLQASGWYKVLWAAEEKAGRPRTDEYTTLTLFSVGTDDEGDYTRYVDFHQWDADDGAQTTWKSFSYDASKAVLSKVQDLEITLDLVAETWDTAYYFDTLSLKASVCE